MRQAIQIGITVVLARYLLPADFGLIGMVSVTLAFVAPFNELGMGAALVQRRDLTPAHATSVFWFQFLMASLAGLLLAAAAPWIAAFFQREDLVPLLRVMCASLPLGAAAAAPQALLLRRLRFARVAGVETAALAGGGLVGAGMAIAGWGVWSLVAQSLIGAALTAALMIVLSGFNPLGRGARPRAALLKDLAGFSAPLAGYNLLNYVSRNIDDILIGRFLGAEALGYYSMAYRVMMYPLQKVSGVVGRVSFPTFAALQYDLERVRRAYVRAAQYIALITFPMMAAVMTAAPEFTRVLFGPGWGPVVPLIVILSLAGMSGSIATTVGSILLARGRSDLMLKWEMASSAGFVLAILSGLPWGLTGVAVAYTMMSLILWPISHYIANRQIDLATGAFFHALLPPAVLAALLGAALLGLRLAWAPSGPADQAAFLVACAGVGVLLFAAAFISGRPAVLRDAVGMVRDALGAEARRG